MRAFNYFALLTLATLTLACNEKISPKLMDANQSTTVPPILEPEEYFFRVNNTSPKNRKFHLHQSGIGNYDKACEIKSTSKLSSTLYRDPARKPEFDITCMFEAEELGLNLYGFSFDFEASANTCETVAYSPFSFYNFQPGDSSATYSMVSCEVGTNESHIDLHPGRPVDANTQRIGCGQMILNGGGYPSTAALPFRAVEDETSLCLYDHSQKPTEAGPNCDVGEIFINEVAYTYTPADEENAAILSAEYKKTRRVKCGGTIAACIDGPIKLEDSSKSSTSVVTYYETKDNQEFKQSRKYEPVENRSKYGNLFYANYRRNLANPILNYIEQPEDAASPGFVNYVEAFRNQRTLYPILLENYAAGLSYDGTIPIFSLSSTNNRTATGLDSAVYPVQASISLASEPFMANETKSGERHRTSPYYTFYCLDSAAEIRGRIKMVVRDWDRFFDTDRTRFELLSDIYDLDNSRMDNPFGVETPGDNDGLNPLNDVRDWDDFLGMKRSAGPLDTTFTEWEPINGFNHRNNFPQITE